MFSQCFSGARSRKHRRLAGWDDAMHLALGARDHSHTYTDPLLLHELIPEAEIVRFDDCGHFPDVEQPERFAAILIESMAKNT